MRHFGKHIFTRARRQTGAGRVLMTTTLQRLHAPGDPFELLRKAGVGGDFALEQFVFYRL
jgi:hypothetical protein